MHGLNALPLKEQNLDLNKEEFRDALRIRYGIPLENLQTKCGEQYSINHALSCKKGGFITRTDTTTYATSSPFYLIKFA